MWAAILAGGKGSRLKPLTESTPKALLRVGDFCLLEWNVANLAKEGITHLVIVTGHDSKPITDFLKEKLSHTPIQVVENGGPGTFSAFSLLRDVHRNEDFLLLGCDLIFDHAILCELIDKWSTWNCDLLEALNTQRPLSEPVYAIIDRKGRMLEFGRQSTGDLYSAGFRICSPAIFREIENASNHGIIRFTDFVGFLIHQKYDVRGLVVDNVINVNTPEELKLACDYIKKKLP